MGIRKKKGQAGEATAYMTRNQALRKLQLSLPNFRRLCVLKGIYPREPRHRTKAQKGDSRIKQLFLRKDIVYLSHEPIIWKIRDYKIHDRKLKTLKGKKDREQARFRLYMQKPDYKLDHIVLERYPSFTKALADLDDPLSTCSLYALLPNLVGIDQKLSQLCRKVTIEFMYYVIEARALRKAFISVKGYYYRAHIQGQKITWMVPHNFTPQPADVHETLVIKWFVEFYTTLLGFVNFKLYQGLNLHYPPQLPIKKVLRTENSSLKEDLSGAIESLSIPLKREFVDGDNSPGKFAIDLLKRKSEPLVNSQAASEMEKARKQMFLFEKKKFFLGRETNRESLTFVIRSCGGLVSWDASLGSGATYTQDDKDIVYEIVDRPKVQKKYLTRYYVQPQWVYDSFNFGILMPVQNYFVGVELPAHVSPFEETYAPNYQPPEMVRLMALKGQVKLVGDRSPFPLPGGSSDDDYDDDDEIMQDISPSVKNKSAGVKPLTKEEIEKNARVINSKKGGPAKNKDSKKDAPAIKKDSKKDAAPAKKKQKHGEMRITDDNDPESSLAKMIVRRGRKRENNEVALELRREKEDFYLAERFIHRKQKKLYKKMLMNEQKALEIGKRLQENRTLYEIEMFKRKMSNTDNVKSKKRGPRKASRRNKVTKKMTTRKGISTTKKGISTTKKGISTTKKGISTTKKGISTTRKGISTTKKGISTTKKGISTTRKGISTTRKGIRTKKNSAKYNKRAS